VTDAELVCIAVAQVLLRFDEEQHWLRAVARQVETCSPAAWPVGVQHQAQAQRRCWRAVLWSLANATPAAAELVRLIDTTPVPCSQSVVTARRSNL